MALTCRQCGIIGSVVDTICRNCGTVLTNGTMPAINNPGSVASFGNSPNPNSSQPWNNNQYNSYPNNGQNVQNGQNWQNQNNLPSWQGYQTQQPTWNNSPNPYQQEPYQQPNSYQQHYQTPQPPAPQMMQMQKWSNQQQPPWGQPQGQQVFIVNGVHPMGLYQEKKSPGLSLVLSFLLTGAGQVYNGQVAKGLLMLGGCIVLWGFLLGWVVSLWSIYDAYATAKKINSGQQV